MTTNERAKFCTCNVIKCPYHPLNHNNGCDLCIEKNLKKGEIPTCFFKVINNDVSSVKKFTIKEFVDFYIKNNNQN